MIGTFDNRIRTDMVRAVNRRKNIFVAFVFVLLFALCGAWADIGCNCHDDADCQDSAACACDCICCGSGVAILAANSGSSAIEPLLIFAFLNPTQAGDSGRLTESFIFTPPRA